MGHYILGDLKYRKYGKLKRKNFFSETGNSKMSDSLKKNLKTHTGEKPFSCKMCYTSFSWKSTLALLMRIHTGEKPYSCEVCSSSFSRKSSLKLHLRVHTGEKPYTCEMCGSSFSRKSHLVAHMQTYTRKYPYSCKMCDSSFSCQSNLKKTYANTYWREAIFLWSVWLIIFKEISIGNTYTNK